MTDRSAAAPGSEISGRPESPGVTWRFHATWIAILGLLSSWSYVETWARNSEFLESFFPLHLLAWTAGYLIASMLIAGAAYIIMPEPKRWDRSYVISAFALVIGQSWPTVTELSDRLSAALGRGPAVGVLVLLAGLVVYAILRVVAAFSSVRPMVSVIVAFLVGAHYLVIAGFVWSSALPLFESSPDRVYPPATLTDKPDVLIVVLDEYGRSDVLERSFGFDNSMFEQRLESKGLAIVPYSKANYSATLLSVAGILDGRYPSFEDLDRGDIAQLRAIHGGDNALFGSLAEAGYETHLFENAWSLANCGDQVDVCHHANMNEVDGRVAARSVLAAVAPTYRIDPWVRRSVDQLDEATDLLRKDSDSPRLVVVHALLPHAPFQLTADCASSWDPRLDSYVVDHQHWELIAEAYSEQLMCVNELLLELLEAAGPDAALFVTGDHGIRFAGADAARQPNAPAAEYLPGIATFTAYRFPAACPALPENTTLMRASAHLFECLGIEIADGPYRATQEDRFFSAYKADKEAGLRVTETTNLVSGLR